MVNAFQRGDTEAGWIEASGCFVCGRTADPTSHLAAREVLPSSRRERLPLAVAINQPHLVSSDNPADAAASGGGSGASATPGLVTVAEFTITTNSISTESIPADQFEMPADWKKIIPEEKGLPELPECPKTGH